MMTDNGELSRRLTALVRAVPGVTTVYSAAPVAKALLRSVSELVLRTDAAMDLVAVEESTDGLRIAVTIGLGDGAPAREVSRRVHDAIADHLTAAGLGSPESISVRIGSVG